MRISRILILCAMISYFLSSHAISDEIPPDVKEIIKKMDRLYRADQSYAEIEMKVVNPNWERTIKMKAWSKGMDKTFIRILSPEKDRGIATLRIGTEMWNYFPKIDKEMRIPPSMMMSSWMGSDFTNDDLVKETTLLDDYNAKLIYPKDMDQNIYYIELTPKEQTASVWGKIVARVKKEGYIPIDEEYYDEDGSLKRMMKFSEVKNMGGRKLPSVMEVLPISKKGQKTVITYLSVDFETKVGDSVFSLRNLKQKQ